MNLMITRLGLSLALVFAVADCFIFNPVPSDRHLHQVKPLHSIGKPVKENEEPLTMIFNRALVFQRAGDHKRALKEYEFFQKAAEECGVSPAMYAEVLVNMGAAHLKDKNVELARLHFEKALKHRQVGAAHVNLALLDLQKASTIRDPKAGMEVVMSAKSHCEEAMKVNDTEESMKTATRLLNDINGMLDQMK